MPYYARLMRREDVAQVTEIDREAFPSLWPPANYKKELQNKLVHYIVACDEERLAEEPVEKGLTGLVARVRRFLNHNYFPGIESSPSDRQYITGFAGFWLIAGEAHITNIAVREIYHRRGVGELLLISMLDLATELNAHMMTLEVRASNTTAQSLYYKYGFNEVELRHGYYRDNKEDAVLMSIENIASALFQTQFQQLKQAHSRRWQ
ncbi:ribosomal protein S18-alanine N-acetyltransferase [Chloroflexota bacterium]